METYESLLGEKDSLETVFEEIKNHICAIKILNLAYWFDVSEIEIEQVFQTGVIVKLKSGDIEPIVQNTVSFVKQDYFENKQLQTLLDQANVAVKKPCGEYQFLSVTVFGVKSFKTPCTATQLSELNWSSIMDVLSDKKKISEIKDPDSITLSEKRIFIEF